MKFQFTPANGYAVVLIGLVLLLILYFSTRLIYRYIASLFYHVTLRYLVYPSLFECLGWQPSAKDTLSAIVFVGANGICVGWDIKSAQELSRRCATLLVTNLIILLPGASIAADILHVPLRSYQSVHSIIGLVALIEGSIHACLELVSQAWDNSTANVTGLATFVCLIFMSATAVPGFRTRFYEVFRMIHIGCSTSICVLLWLHISTASGINRIQVGLGLGVWAATYAHRNLLLMYRNFSFSKPRTQVLIQNIHNNLKVSVSVSRPWVVKPGQYVYLTMLRPGVFSIFQRHPFVVAQTESSKYDFELRIQPASGFTRRLLGASLGESTCSSAFIEGPYGYGLNLRDFGTIILLASGIGIVGHIPYIQELVQDVRHSKTKTRDLLLVWLVENKTQRDLVSEVMTKVLRNDDLPLVSARTVLSEAEQQSKLARRLGDSDSPDRPGERPKPHGENIVDMYIYGDYDVSGTRGSPMSQKREGSRIAEIQGRPDIPQIIGDVLKTRTGRVAVCACAFREIRNAARRTVAQNIKRDIRYLEYDFQPTEPKNYMKRSDSLPY